MKRKSCGYILCGSSNVLSDVEVVQPFPKENSPTTDGDLGKQRYEAATKGVVEIEKIFMTKQHMEFMTKLKEFEDSPLIPKGIQAVLVKLNETISGNLVGPIKVSLQEFILASFDKHVADNPKWDGKFNPAGVYNDFNHNRYSHKQQIAELRSEVREYLRVDSMP